MIVFDLHCSRNHAFEGWFASGDAYADQRGRKLVRCPVCDDPEIEKRLSSRVTVRKAHARAAPAAAEAPAPAPASDVASGLPVDVLDKLRAIVRNTEDVGGRFAEEARKIHYEEVPARAIRGHATREEAAELHEEGIDFSALPPALTRNSH